MNGQPGQKKKKKKKKQLDHQSIRLRSSREGTPRKVPVRSSKTKYRSVGPPIPSNPNRSVAMICTRKKTTWKVYQRAALLKSKQKNCGFSSTRITDSLFDVPLISIHDDFSVKMKSSREATLNYLHRLCCVIYLARQNS